MEELVFVFPFVLVKILLKNKKEADKQGQERCGLDDHVAQSYGKDCGLQVHKDLSLNLGSEPASHHL